MSSPTNEPIPAEPPTRLYLVRHGQAVVNVEPIMGGMKGDTGLTPLGVEQATRLRDRLQTTGEIKPDVFIASTLPRARQTAQIIAPAFPDVPLVMDDDVQEFRVGPEADGLSFDDYKARFGWHDFADDVFQATDPGGESWATFLLRVGQTLTRITTEHRGKTIVVVCHGGIIDASFMIFFGLNAFSVPAVGLHTVNTSLTLWERVSHRNKMRWQLSFYNDDAHLRGAGVSRGTNIDYTAHAPVAAPTSPMEPTHAEAHSASAAATVAAAERGPLPLER